MPGPKLPDEMEGVEKPLEEEKLGKMVDGGVDDLRQKLFDSGDMVDEPGDGVNAYETTGEAEPIDQQAINERERNRSEATSPFDTGIPTPKPKE